MGMHLLDPRKHVRSVSPKSMGGQSMLPVFRSNSRRGVNVQRVHASPSRHDRGAKGRFRVRYQISDSVSRSWRIKISGAKTEETNARTSWLESGNTND